MRQGCHKLWIIHYRFPRHLQKFDLQDAGHVVLGPLPPVDGQVPPEVDHEVRRWQRGRHLPGVDFTSIYEQLLSKKVFGVAFMCVQFDSAFFGKRKLVKKLQVKNLVKLTTGVNFTTSFSALKFLHIFSVLAVWLYIFWQKDVGKKSYT